MHRLADSILILILSLHRTSGRGHENAKNAGACRLRRDPPPAAASSSAPKRVPPTPRPGGTVGMIPARPGRYRKRAAWCFAVTHQYATGL